MSWGPRHPRENQSDSRCQLVRTGSALSALHPSASQSGPTRCSYTLISGQNWGGGWVLAELQREHGLWGRSRPWSAHTSPLYWAAQGSVCCPVRSLTCGADFNIPELQTATEVTGVPSEFLHVRSPGDPGTRHSASPQVAQIKWLNWGKWPYSSSGNTYTIKRSIGRKNV